MAAIHGAFFRPRLRLFPGPTFIALVVISPVFISLNISAETIREFHERMCAQGKPDSCARAQAMKKGEEHANWIDELGTDFSRKVNRGELEEDNKPKLDQAYPIVLNDYFIADLRKNATQHRLEPARMRYCADHYHNYWRNRKMIWPVNRDNTPDWAKIYFFIVEHYYGYCLRPPF